MQVKAVSGKSILLMTALTISSLFASFSVGAEDINLMCVPQHHTHTQSSGKFGRDIECSKFQERYPDKVGCHVFELYIDTESKSAVYSVNSYKQYFDVEKTNFDYKLVRSTMKLGGVGGTEVVIRIDRRDLTFSYEEVWSLFSSIAHIDEIGWCIKLDAVENKI